MLTGGVIMEEEITMVEKLNKSTKKMVQSGSLKDFKSLKDHIIVQNNERYEFKKGKKASETNEEKIPSKYEGTLKVEGVIK